MNALYENIDAVLTNPSAVTISECLFKRKPIIVYDALPGQEQINLKHLKDLGPVFHVNKEEIPENIYDILQNQLVLKRFYHHVSDFHSNLDSREPIDLILELIAN
jgi:processive 1,2-diacylglycerol beta-glucosyltransferase